MINDTKSTKMGQALAITCFVSNLSQFPVFVSLGISSYLAIGTWLMFFAFCLVYHLKWKIERGVMPVIIFISIYTAFLCVMQVFSDNKYLNSGLTYPIFLSFFIMFFGTNVGKIIKEKDFSNIISAYVYSALIVCVYIFAIYLINPYDNVRYYSYASKNSISQILLTGALLTFLFKMQDKSVIKNLIHIGIAIFFVASLLLLRSRATLIAIPFIVLFIIIFGSQKYKNFRIIAITLLVLGFLVLLLIPNAFNTLINDIIFGGRDSSDLDDLSSGRFGEWLNFFSDLGDGWFFGIGSTKRESLILTSILSYGFPMGIAVILFALTPFIFSLRHIKNRDGLITLVFYLGFIYFLNGIFEQLAPFGPGVKCYMLWLMFGIALARQNMQENKSLGVLF